METRVKLKHGDNRMSDKNLLWSGRGTDHRCKAGRVQASAQWVLDNYSRRRFLIVAFDADGNFLGKRKTVQGAKSLVENNYSK